MQITNPIIPNKPVEVLVSDKGELDLKAICIFTAIGFFLDADTYWTHKKVLRPATNNQLDTHKKVVSSESYFHWHYTPRRITFDEALEEFTSLFETIVSEQIKDKKVILPLSGGLDSRTQAGALKHLGAKVSSYSYEFENGYPETKIAQQIAKVCDFDFQSFKIGKGYLWNTLNELANINQCQSDFTSPRQMAIADQFSAMGDVFSLGHWGDVLFDSYNCPELSHKAQIEFLIKKLLKRGGLEFASNLWTAWNLEGDFESHLKDRISNALGTIAIEDTNARLRAFKSKYSAPRWASVNLSIFENRKPITLPYYDNRMCEFICTIPEDYLKDRQLQIAYLKKRNPELARLTWQDKRPYNFYTYQNPKTLRTFTYKVGNKLKRMVQQISGRPYIQRNWELQFLGEDNRNHLERVLDNNKLSGFIPDVLVKKYISDFYNLNPLQNAHALNMLIVLAKFNETQNHD